MATVLNRETKQVLHSVNTPEYPIAEWVINPDLSQVQGVPSKYWVIETTTETQEELVAVDDYDNPIYETVTTQYDTIRPMTTEEQQAYDLNNPEVPLFTGKLLDNATPAYLHNGTPVSVHTLQVSFSTATNNARNFYLDCLGQPAVDNGYRAPWPIVLRSVVVSFGRVLTSQAILRFRAAGSSDNLFSIEVPSGVITLTVADLFNRVEQGVALTCFLESSKNVRNPIVICYFSQVD